MRKLFAAVASLSLVAAGLWLATASPAGASAGNRSKVVVSTSAKTQTQRQKPRIVLRATVRPSDGSRARGYVKFKTGGKMLTKAAVHHGVARAKLPSRAPRGKHKIRAVFVPKADSGERVSRSSRKGAWVNVKVNPRDRKWDRLASCESGGRWGINTGNGYYGGLQFTASTWRSVGGSGMPHRASRLEQIDRGKRLKARSGAGQWPHCGRVL